MGRGSHFVRRSRPRVRSISSRRERSMWGAKVVSTSTTPFRNAGESAGPPTAGFSISEEVRTTRTPWVPPRADRAARMFSRRSPRFAPSATYATTGGVPARCSRTGGASATLELVRAAAQPLVDLADHAAFVGLVLGDKRHAHAHVS